MHHPACDHREKGIIASGKCALNFWQSRLKTCIRIEESEGSHSFCSYPIAPGIGLAGRQSRPSLFDKSSEVAIPLCDLRSGHGIGWTLTEVFRYCDQRMQHIMQFIGVANIGPGFLANLCNRRRIELANFF